jgi:lipopolysaccharide/colanic/teichoic acid biosynthesis glycosyltransferase
VFNVIKFRTMHQCGCDSTAKLQTVANDPRITVLGRCLRRYHLDEYPQLINILKGDMSFVGPRPHPIGMLVGGVPYAGIVPDHNLRHSVRPGLTGLAQVNGAVGPIENADEALRRHGYDVLYLEAMSFSKDIAIILETIKNHLTSILDLLPLPKELSLFRQPNRVLIAVETYPFDKMSGGALVRGKTSRWRLK